MLNYRVVGVVCAILLGCGSAGADKRPIEADDFYRGHTLADLACAPDGKSVAYTVTTVDKEADELKDALWEISWDGKDDRRLTQDSTGVSRVSYSPNGRYIAFISARGDDEDAQLYVLDRRGGDAQALTSIAGDVIDYQWSPDSQQLVLVLADVKPKAQTPKAKADQAPKPFVINQFSFKEDISGYARPSDRTHLYLLSVNTHELTALTQDAGVVDKDPVWSTDSKKIAYVSDHSGDAAPTAINEIDIIDAVAGAKPQKLTSFFAPNHQSLVWIPNTAQVAYLVGFEPRIYAYSHDRLAVVDVKTGTSRVVTEKLNRAVSDPVVTGTPGVLSVIVEDDRSRYPATVSLATGEVHRTLTRALAVTEQCSAAGHIAVLAATDDVAPEIYSLEKNQLRKLSSHNDELMAELNLGSVEDISFNSRDGTEVHGLIIKPVDYDSSKRYPTILWIHGGPNGQDEHGLLLDAYPLQFEREWFASHGYVVLAINYRGSSGRGPDFQRAIWADWGHLEVEDLLAGVDYAVKAGIADPNRLGIGGWSYGGILTDYTIASDTRFKAAISGAGSGNQLSMFGSDQYVMQYLNELGAPWKNLDLWIKVSYPFFHADKIKTPTLFMGGSSDFNVPIAGGEQMYQALRAVGTPAELVVYPRQFHLFTRPSYVRDRIVRYTDWYDRYLKPQAP